MIKRYYFTLFLAFLCSFAPMQAMENKPSKEQLNEFYGAIRKHDLDTVKGMLDSNINFEDKDKTAALTWAIKRILFEPYNNTEVLELLLRSGFQPRESHMLDGNFCYTSISKNKNQIFHLLLSHGTAIDSSDNRPYQEEGYNLLRCLEILKQNELIDIVKAHINTRLYHAILKDDTEEVKRLVQKYSIDINTSLNCYGSAPHTDYGTPSTTIGFLSYENICTETTPLIISTLLQKEKAIAALVNDLNAKVNIQDKNGWTALHWNFLTVKEGNEWERSWNPHIRIAEFLLSKGACPYIPSFCGNDKTGGPKPMDYVATRLKKESDKKRIEDLKELKNRFEKASPLIWLNNPPIIETNPAPSTAQKNQSNQGSLHSFQPVKNIADIDKKNASTYEPKINLDSSDDEDTTSSEEDTSDLKQTTLQNPQQTSHNNPQKPVTVEPNNDPIDDQTTVITKSILPWKLIGAGVAVVAVATVAKKIYDWYYPKTEEQEAEKSESEQANEQQPEASHA